MSQFVCQPFASLNLIDARGACCGTAEQLGFCHLCLSSSAIEFGSCVTVTRVNCACSPYLPSEFDWVAAFRARSVFKCIDSIVYLVLL